MAALNEIISIGFDDEVRTLGVYAAESPPKDEAISDIDEDKVPSIVEIASEFTLVTPSSASLPRKIVDAPRISFSLPGRAKALA
jgi:hypothetical protein